MTRLLGSLSGLGGGGGVAPADLTGPAAPAPVSLASGTTALGSTSIGSWSASVTVTAAALGSDLSTPTVTVTGSGAGPYSVSIASGLSDGVTYRVVLTGTGADGQVATAQLSVAVREPATITGSIAWEVVADYDFTQCSTSSRVTSGTVTSGGGLPDWTLASDSGTAFGVTPTNGTGLVLDSTGTARGFVHFTPNWASLGIDLAGTDAYAVELQLTGPVYGASAFTTYQVGSAANPNGTGSGAGGRCINSGGNRNGNARSNSAGTSELSSTTLFSVAGADPSAVSFLGGFISGESANSVLNGTLPASGPGGYTIWRDGAARAIGTGAGYSPGFVSLLFGGGTITGGAISRVRIWRRGVV
jgi:hypothetical protein